MSVDFEKKVGRTYNFNFHRDFSKGKPRDEDTIDYE
jgi:hypothetical protein